MKSLFILSLPRSMSSLIYVAAHQTLGLRAPQWTSSGEILNTDRHALHRGAGADDGIKYLRPRHAPALCERIIAFLDDVVQPTGHVYKDVVNPFVMAAWPGLCRHPVLVIERPLADVATAMLARGWRYPGHALRQGVVTDDEVLEGLLLAERALAAIPAARVRYDDLVRDEGALHAALQALYPDRPVPRPRYIDAAFRAARGEALARRRQPRYRQLDARLDALRAPTR